MKYVKRNALAGRRFGSWEELNAWLERWSSEVAVGAFTVPPANRPSIASPPKG